MDTGNTDTLQELRNKIEEKLDWGTADNWSNRDFKNLSELILQRTGKRVSVTTLKRMMGRAQRIAHPSLSTLDILVEFLGYENWRTYEKHRVTRSDPSLPKPQTNFWTLKKVWIMLTSVAFIGAVWFWLKKPAHSRKLSANEKEQIEFDFYKVTSGYPNTVVFNYDMGDLHFDSLTIQQSWDESKRIALEKSNGLVTSTYYSPGYYMVKLLVDGQTVKERPLYIPSEKWQGQIWGQPNEIKYLDPEQIMLDDSLHLMNGVLEEIQNRNSGLLYLAHLAKHPIIDSKNFTLEGSFRLTHPNSNSICGNMRLTITGTQEVLGFQFSRLGCVGDLVFYLNRDIISGKEYDLSAFGITQGEWIDLKVEAQNSQLKVYRQNQMVFEYEMSSDIGLIGGVQWHVEGLLEIRDLVIKDDEEEVNLIDRKS